MESSNLNGQVRIAKFSEETCIAREIEIMYVGKQPLPKITPEMMVLIKNWNEWKIFSIGDRITVPYYGKSLAFKIVAVVKGGPPVASTRKEDLCEALSYLNITDDRSKDVEFYNALYCTKWRVASITEEENVAPKKKLTIDDIGGYGTLIDDLRDVIDAALGKWKKIKGFKVRILHNGSILGQIDFSSVNIHIFSRSSPIERNSASIFLFNNRVNFRFDKIVQLLWKFFDCHEFFFRIT